MTKMIAAITIIAGFLLAGIAEGEEYGVVRNSVFTKKLADECASGKYACRFGFIADENPIIIQKSLAPPKELPGNVTCGSQRCRWWEK